MSDTLRGFALARESAFFKLEQEADLQRHTRRLINEGIIQEATGSILRPPRQDSFEHSVAAFEVLPEVLQQQARLDDPHVAQRREVLRRIKAMPAKLSDSELRRYSSSVYGLAAACAVPGMTFGRGRYSLNSNIPSPPPPQIPVSPAVAAMARGTYAIGFRAVVYGTVGAVLGLAVAGTAAAQAWGVRSLDDFKALLTNWAEPMTAAMETSAGPVRERVQAFLAGDQDSQQRHSELQERLVRRFNPAKSGVHPSVQDDAETSH